MEPQNLKIILAFSLDDQAWIRRSSIVVPKVGRARRGAPAAGDALRIGGRQFVCRGGSGSTTAARRYCASS